MKESERLKDDGRLDVSITVGYQLKCLSDGRSITDPETVATMVLGEYRDEIA